MASLIVDIETAGEDWSKIDAQTQKVLVERINRLKANLAEEESEELAEAELGFSPYTGEIVALGLLDYESAKGAVYYQAGDKKVSDKVQDGVKLSVLGEAEMLTKFWELSERYTEFITFSGRTFDIPFIMIRSAILGVKPKKDLMRGRYLYQQSPSAIHIDLHDQLSFYSAIPRLGGLHLACRAFGIETPKDGVIDGSLVPEFYRQGKFEEIAEYNARDLLATRLLYEKWKKYLAF